MRLVIASGDYERGRNVYFTLCKKQFYVAQKAIREQHNSYLKTEPGIPYKCSECVRARRRVIRHVRQKRYFDFNIDPVKVMSIQITLYLFPRPLPPLFRTMHQKRFA